MKKVVVLGAGMVGSAIAIDLCHQHPVTVVDWDRERLGLLETRHPVKTTATDISNPEGAREVIKDHDLVIGALPGFMGFETLRTVIMSGKDVVDISFFEESAFELDRLAKERGVTAIVDCGVAPGMGNIILGYHNERMTVDYYECLVGGLPVKRRWPFQYKAPFSPIDVIEEYTRPVRMVENGRMIEKPPLSDPEYVDVDPVGTLEAFNTDGLRTLLKTMNIPTMKEKTLRYPGHLEYIRVLRESGFFRKEPIEIKGTQVRPIDVTAKLLLPTWRLDPDEPEFTVMRIRIGGEEGGKRKQYTYRLYDEFDKTTGLSSMARTTGYTCSAVVRLVLEGAFTLKGICPPEYVGAKGECFQRIMADLEARRVNYTCDEQPI